MIFAPIALVGCLAQDEDKTHPQVYERVVDSVVGVRATNILGERSGTGFILDSDGLIITSYWIVPEGATEIRVYLHGPRLCTAQIVGTSKKDDFSLIRIKTNQPLKPVTMGRSSRVKVGEVSYTLGNAENCIIKDDQPALNWGIISGMYNLKEAKQDSYYTGYVLETTAAVNWNMEGAPLLNAAAEVVGLITLNYSPHRWLGNAIPIDSLKGRIRRLLEGEATPKNPEPEPSGTGYLGFTLKQDAKGQTLVDQVDPQGPAAQQGIQPGDFVESVGGKPILKVEDFLRITEGIKAGSLVEVQLKVLGISQKINLEATARPKSK